MTYLIEFTPEAVEHLSQLTARQQSTVFDAIEVQLKHEPMVETRNRKPMRPNPLAPWELRVGTARVYYETVVEPRALVRIRAIGVSIASEFGSEGPGGRYEDARDRRCDRSARDIREETASPSTHRDEARPADDGPRPSRERGPRDVEPQQPSRFHRADRVVTGTLPIRNGDSVRGGATALGP